MSSQSVRPALPTRSSAATLPLGTVRSALPDQTGVRIDQPPSSIDGTVRRAIPNRQPVRQPARRTTPRS